MRNMRSIGIDLQPWVAAGGLRILAARPAAYGLETHLARIGQAVEEFEPAIVVLDPLSATCEGSVKYSSGRPLRNLGGRSARARPQLARGDQIVAIPTLVRKLPPPIRSVTGDLSDTERALVGLHPHHASHDR